MPLSPYRGARMRIALLTAVALLATSAAVHAATPSMKITGTVRGAAGMTLLALSPSGTAVQQKLGASGRFTLKVPRGQGTTLQLVTAGGRYFGPVVLASKKGKAYSAIAPAKSVKLGTLSLRTGFATPKKALPQAIIDRTRALIADTKGRPLGVGKLGLVKMPGLHASSLRSPAAGGTPQNPGADGDADGLPNALDMDGNGNGLIDSFDSSARSPSSGLFSTLFLGFNQALNANAAGVSRPQIDAAVGGENTFNMIWFFDDSQFKGEGLTVTGAHVDCGALVYCRRGDGTAIMGGLSESSPSTPRNVPWVSFTPDGSGLPNLDHMTSHDGGSVWATSVQPRVGTSDLRPGDTYDVVFNTSGGARHVPTVLAPYFVTTPAISSYAAGAAPAQTISYPPAADAPGANQGNPIVLDASGKLSLTIWRPQRLAVPGAETGDFMDMGHLHYGLTGTTPDGSREVACAGFYSNLSPSLTQTAAGGQDFGTSLFPLTDSGADSVPSVVDTLSFTLDVAGCYGAAGAAAPGSTIALTLTAAGESRPGGMDRGAQMVYVRFA
ncbi:MAG: hypothetical protein QOE87_1172 [Gaiellales bacterium]|nr:hypothetical protein [Gaiellales bacterium]